jgi:hypothetical protein
MPRCGIDPADALSDASARSSMRTAEDFDAERITRLPIAKSHPAKLH